MTDHAAVTREQRTLRRALDVDKSRRDYQPACVDALARRHIFQRTGWRDTRDTVAANADVAVEPRVARAVDHPAAGHDEIVRRFLGVQKRQRRGAKN